MFIYKIWKSCILFLLKINFFQVDFDKIVQSYLNEDYINKIYTELTKADNAEWKTPGIKALFQLTFQIFISLLNAYINDTGKLMNFFAITNDS